MYRIEQKGFYGVILLNVYTELANNVVLAFIQRYMNVMDVRGTLKQLCVSAV